MKKYKDQLTDAVSSCGEHRRVPIAVAAKSHRVLRLLEAAGRLEDVARVTCLGLKAMKNGRLAVPIQGKWIVSFEWLDSFGAVEMQLHRDTT